MPSLVLQVALLFFSCRSQFKVKNQDRTGRRSRLPRACSGRPARSDHTTRMRTLPMKSQAKQMGLGIKEGVVK